MLNVYEWVNVILKSALSGPWLEKRCINAVHLPFTCSGPSRQHFASVMCATCECPTLRPGNGSTALNITGLVLLRLLFLMEDFTHVELN